MELVRVARAPAFSAGPTDGRPRGAASQGLRGRGGQYRLEHTAVEAVEPVKQAGPRRAASECRTFDGVGSLTPESGREYVPESKDSNVTPEDQELLDVHIPYRMTAIDGMQWAAEVLVAGPSTEHFSIGL